MNDQKPDLKGAWFLNAVVLVLCFASSFTNGTTGVSPVETISLRRDARGTVHDCEAYMRNTTLGQALTSGTVVA